MTLKKKLSPRREQKLRDAARFTQPDLTVILENLYDPFNVSAVMRSCDSVGIREIYVVFTEPTLLTRKGLILGKRTSGGTNKWMDVFVFENLHECFTRVKEKYQRILATMPIDGGSGLYDLDLTQPTALLFGNEHSGISKEALELSDGFFTIPQAGFTESLNISVACAVSLYEGYRQISEKGYYSTHPPLNAEQQELLYQRWTSKMTALVKNKGIYVDQDSPEITPVYEVKPYDTQTPANRKLKRIFKQEDTN